MIIIPNLFPFCKIWKTPENKCTWVFILIKGVRCSLNGLVIRLIKLRIMIRREIRKKIKIKRIVRIRISRGKRRKRERRRKRRKRRKKSRRRRERERKRRKRRERKRKGSINLIFNIY